MLQVRSNFKFSSSALLLPFFLIHTFCFVDDVVDLTDDDNNDSESAADQKEVSIGKVSEKTFPSLVVTVRVCLRSKDIPTSVANSERVQLGNKFSFK